MILHNVVTLFIKTPNIVLDAERLFLFPMFQANFGMEDLRVLFYEAIIYGKQEIKWEQR